MNSSNVGRRQDRGEATVTDNATVTGGDERVKRVLGLSRGAGAGSDTDTLVVTD